MIRVLILLWLSLPLGGAEPAFTAVTDRLAPVPLDAGLMEAARKAQISLEGMDTPAPGDTVNPGDTFTAVVTLHQKNDHPAQWLLHLLAETPDPKGQSRTNSSKMLIHNSLGHKMEFNSLPAPVALRTLGPYPPVKGFWGKKGPYDDTERFSLDQGFLGLGLDQGAAAILRSTQMKLKGPFASGSTPLDAKMIEASKKFADELKMTEAEERALSGSYPALLSYFNTVQQTPRLRDLLQEVLDPPSVWSVVSKGGIKSIEFKSDSKAIVPDAAEAWGLPPGTAVFRSPMMLLLNGHPSIKMTLVVTAPRPPFLPCAGVVGLLAEKPDDNSTYLTLRIISARRAAPRK